MPAPRSVKKSPPRRPQGTWARIRAEALRDLPEIAPYLIEDVDPVIEIPAPETAEQMLAIGAFFNNEGEFRIADAKAVLEVVCGDQFAAVWNLVRREKLPVLLGLIRDMGEHFDAQGALENVDEDDVPGGSEASSR